jgi:hypothetical protein
MRSPLFVPLALLAACASGGGNVPLGGAEQTINLADGTGGVLRMRGSDGARVSSIAAPIDKVWRVLPAVFDSLGIALTDINPATHLMGNGGMKVHAKLGTTSLGKYIDCGNTQGFSSAESYDVQMSVKTQVEAAKDGGTTIGTLVEAVGRPMAFAGEYVRCSTKGELEQRIADGARAQLRP